MPVTARLSKAFYDRFGEIATNELVDWFNAVDSTYRADLRELNELNFARFDAKLEQRLAEFKATIAASETRLIRWMFAFWTGNLVAMAGLSFAVMRLGR